MHRLALVASLSFVVIGCPSPEPVAPDAPVGGVCVADRDCDDGLFCNGRETCRPAASDAGARGCIAGADPCGGTACDEATATCEGVCTGEPDADGDGEASIACGGLDCDDTDPLRAPGHTEICGADDHDEDCDPTTFGDHDLDGDGETDGRCCNGAACGSDCDDTRRGVNGSVPEVCDHVDNDCDGNVDEGLLETLYLDSDHDGIGDAAREITSCRGDPGASEATGDCDDTQASVRPTAPEICDALDNDCDGDVDEDAIAVPWYVDADGDGWGTVSATDPSVDSCVRPAGRAIRVGDCNDEDGAVSPTAAERCNGLDDDCDGAADYLVGGRDTEDDDRDGVPDAACGATTSDCDDRDPLASLATSVEICDDRDNDCDARIDEDAAPVAWYVDMDGDGFGDPSGATVTSCDIEPGRARNQDDCDDVDAGTYPGAVDSCTGRLHVDDDCDGSVDEGGTSLSVYADLDEDGYGVGVAVRSCLVEARSSTRSGDCDDTEARVNPGALDDCAAITGVDDDCDTRIDETLTPRTFYSDPDGDHFGSGTGTSGCMQPAGTATANGDCDESTILRNPSVPDDCATVIGVDDDCDASVDEGRVLVPYYPDRDGDGFGTEPPAASCTRPTGTSAVAGDCDDGNVMRSPAAPDDCSRPMSVDDDCDGMVDEDATFMSAFRDVDGDGYGSGPSMLSCGTPVGYSTVGGDCDETSLAIHPGRPDDCTTLLGVDDDCSGVVDQSVMLRSWWVDGDGDGAGVGTPLMACTATGRAPFGDDCDDANANRHPRRPDDCTTSSGIDDDCDTRIDEAAVFTTYYRDSDGDGFGDLTVTMPRCGPTAGYVTNSTDCDDSRMGVRPGGTEVCANGLDDDCNTLRDCADGPCTAGCGTTMVVSGGAQSAPIHGLLAAPLRVRVSGGGLPLAGRSVTLTTFGVSGTTAAVTDAAGDATFDLRAGFRLGPETITVSAFGVPDVTTTVIATAPPAGTILSLYNGPRFSSYRGEPGPTYAAGTDPNASSSLAGAPDGTLYFFSGSRIHRIDATGRVSIIAGSGGIFGPPIPDSTPAMSASIVAGGTPILALDAPRNRLYFTRSSCGVYYLDLTTMLVRTFANTTETCGFSGDGAAARDAQLDVIFSMAVNQSGVLFTASDGWPGPGMRRIRYIDTAGRIDSVIASGGGTPALTVGAFFGPIAPIPGSDSVLASIPDCQSPGIARPCVVRLTAGGAMTLVAGGVGSSTMDGIPATTARLTPLTGGNLSSVALGTGEIVIAEVDSHRIRIVDVAGNIRTLAGTLDTPGDSGDGGLGTAALVRNPYYLTAWSTDHVAFWQLSARAIRGLW